MPSGVRKNKAKCGVRGYEIFDKNTGAHIGCSSNKKDAHIAAWKRDSAHKAKHGGKGN